MKVLCTHSVDVAAPVERVFSFVTEIGKWPVWLGCVVSAEQPDHRPVALNEEIHLCLHAGKKRRHETFDVTRYVSNTFFSLEGSYSAARRFDFRFEQRGPSTRLSCAIGYPMFGGLFRRVVDRLFVQPRIGRELRDSLSHLRNVLDESVDGLMQPETKFDQALPAAATAQREAEAVIVA